MGNVVTLLPGETYANPATTISTEKATYTTSDDKVATVDQNGTVTAVGFGEATITASVKSTAYYQAGSTSYKVKVGSVLQKALKNGATVEIILQDGDTKIEKKFVNENGNFNLQNPVVGAYYGMNYNSDDKVINFVQSINLTQTFSIKFGVTDNTYHAYAATSSISTQFSAIKIDGKDVLSQLTKKEVAVEGIFIIVPTYPFEMNIGDADVTLTTWINPFDATDKKLTWSSSAPAVATVDQTGKVHAVAAGTTTIKAVTSNGKEASVELTVNLPKATFTAPTAKTGIKAGENAAIINAGVATGGTMMYKVTTANTKPTTTDGFSATVPTAQNLAAGTYYVWYYVKADNTHADSDIEGSVSVTIASAIISTKDASETFTPTAGTVTGTYFKVSGIKTNYGWQIGTGNHQTITISSPDGLNLSQVVLTVGTHPGTPQRNPSHLEVNHGTLTVTGTTPGNTVTISNINSPSVTLSAPGSDNNASRWTFTQAVVDGKGDASK